MIRTDCQVQRVPSSEMNQASVAPSESFKWPVGVATPIGAPVGKVWAAMSMPGNLEWCHPFCAVNPVTAWPGPGSQDEVHYYNGLVYQRRFVEWVEGVGYDLEIGESDQRKSLVQWRLEPDGHNRSTLTITVFPWLLQDLPTAVRWLPHRAYLKPLLGRYLSAVGRGFEWYVTRGIRVTRNQFGPHPWFSPANRRLAAGMRGYPG